MSKLREKMEQWMKKENSSRSGGVLRFSTSLSSRDRRLVHEMATRNGFFHSSFRDAETELKFVAVSRTQKALEELSSSMKKPRSKFLFADTSDTMRSLEKSQITYGFEEYAKRLNASSSGRFDHPHRERVSRMANKPPSNLLQHVHQTETFTPHEGCVFVNTDVQLRASLSEVELETEIAVSVKSHFLRSYYGFACLIVLSTRKKTFVIDALALRHQISSELKSLFVSPRVLKVFHSGGKCIQTLSRDFGINVVHVFDTRCAARELNIKVVKLQSLLVDSCGILRDESKIKLLGDSVRLSHRVDWRFRPLSEQALAFPVIETKYLLFLFDVLSKRLTLMSKKEDNLSEESGEDLEISYCGSSSENEGGDDEEDDDWLDDVMEDLYGKDVDEKKEVKETENVERNLTSRDKIGLLGNDSVANVDSVDFSDDLPELVARAYANSQLLVLKFLWHPVPFKLDSYKRDRTFRTSTHFRAVDISLFRDLYSLRDVIARELDESPSFVCPSAALCALVDRMPQDLETLSQCWWPLPTLFLDDKRTLSKVACRFLVVIKSYLNDGK